MHDDLRRFGLRRVRLWTIAYVAVSAISVSLLACFAMLEPEWPPNEMRITGGWRTVEIGAAAGALLAIGLVIGGGWSGTRRAWPTVDLDPAPDLLPWAEGLAIARNEPVPRVWRLHSNAPNVACLPGPHGRHLIVSTGAERGLGRYELEAVMALQFSLLIDRGAGRVRRSLVAAGLMITWLLRLSLLALIIALVRDLPWAGLTINVAIWLPALLITLVVFVQRRIRWSWGMVGDGVAVETTRHPDALVAALRRLAGYNGDPVPVRRTFGAADPYWAVPVRAHVKVETFVVNGRARNRRSTEQQSDATLLLRARIVDQVCVGHEPATVASWRLAADTFERLGRAAGDSERNEGQRIDGTIDGVTVSVDGATAGSLPPKGGPWLPESPSALATWKLRGSRPRPPSAGAIVAYDQYAGGTRR